MTPDHRQDEDLPAAVDAIVLAGSRPVADPLAIAANVPVKALVPVAGRAMLAHVMTTLLGHTRIGKLSLLAQDYGPLNGHPDTAALLARPEVAEIVSQATIATSLEQLLGQPDTAYPLVITTADNVLLNTAMIDDFLSAATGVDIAIAVVEKPVLLARFPDSRRTWLPLRGGEVSGANLFYFGSPDAQAILRYWAEVEQDRKKGWKILTIFGPWLLLLALLRVLTIDQLADRVGTKLGLCIKVIRMTQAEACIDVDKPADLALVEQILAARGDSPNT